MAPLDQAIEGLYATFARYPLAPHIHGCPHCALGSAERSLHRASLRELTVDDLGVFSFKAMTTFGSVDDFRHFLPRIAELLTFTGLVGACDLCLLADKLAYGEWGAWPAPERGALSAWFRALEDDYLFHGRSAIRARDLISAMEARGGDVDGFVARWPEARELRAIGELADEVLELASSSNTGRPRATAVLTQRRDAIERTLRRALETDARTEVLPALEVLGFPPFA